jgi:TonB family protein
MTNTRTAITLILAATALGGCGNARDLSSDMRGAGTRSRAPATKAGAGSTALTIEQASQKLDLGKKVKSSRATLERIVADPATSADDHDRAALALSRAYQAAGDHEHAIRTVEGLLAAHVDDHRWALSRAASKELRRLLTGKAEDNAPSFDPDRVVSPFARVLAPYFPVGADKRLSANILLFGGEDATSNKLGTFAVGDAAREMRLERCPLCQDDLRRDIHVGRTSWTGIPAYRDRLSGALDVFYFDLGSERIPTRYEQYLPLPEKEIVSHLQNGEGVIAARERKGGPPSILIAAPRRAQLPDVEEALSKRTSLPTEPAVVKVSPAPRPGEIRGVVRAAFPGFKSCYDKLLASAPAATGRVMLKFTIGADGSVTDSSIDAARSSLQDNTFDGCTLDVTRKLRFPASGHGSTTVDYPITFSPEGADAP